MSACLISDEEDRLLAATHLVGTNQLPLPDNVGTHHQHLTRYFSLNFHIFLITIDYHHMFTKVKKKYPEVMTIDPESGERAMLVKDHEGDSAFLVGRWEVHNQEMASMCPHTSN